ALRSPGVQTRRLARRRGFAKPQPRPRPAFGLLYLTGGGLGNGAAAQDVGPPEGDEFLERTRDVEQRYLALALETRPMPDAGLGDLDAEQASTGQHLRVDEEATGFGQDALERLAPEDLEGAVDIADARAQQAANDTVIAPG